MGVVIGPKGIKVEGEKIKDVLDWLTPKEVQDIQKFLGLVNYYCQFIKNFCHMPSPLVQKLHSCGDIVLQLYKPTFLTTHLIVVMQPSRYSISHDKDTPI